MSRKYVPPVCNKDCERCPYPDCINDTLDYDDYVASAKMEKEFILPKTAKQKSYYEANREKIAAQQKSYREANREKILAQQKSYYEANRENLTAQKKLKVIASLSGFPNASSPPRWVLRNSV